ncbi:hypothetical protein LXM94_23825 [Rhizobium sp. TRM95111]|uniref:hypothetical protein n=1 Tax=Rhizobium alarense TaxID=2846851 RepID=UPI001F2564CF|nr:hypothetical protein [Rhizobium alarense]MCF3642996.1 hypothetical protein [Rhizobium alarense]
MIQLVKIVRTEGIFVEIKRGETTINLYPLSTKDAAEAALDREMDVWAKKHGRR